MTPEEREAQDKKHASRQYWIQASYIALGAIFGTFVRILLAQLFGEECDNSGSVGWLNAGSPLCVTTDGQTLRLGGIIFADLPANMLGTFLMGFFQDGAVLGLAIPLALAWLPPHHPFQGMITLHTAVKVGLCGSLATFSSWNSEMVILIFGTGTNRQPQVMHAILGYIIGMQTAMASFVCGKAAARWVHKLVNPELAAEIKSVQKRQEEGVYIHYELPDFERRFLTRLDLGDGLDALNQSSPVPKTDALEKWRASTESCRKVRHEYLPFLLDIERISIIARERIPAHLENIARDQGWDIEALILWEMQKTQLADGRVPTISSVTFTGQVQAVCKTSNSHIQPEDTFWFRLPAASFQLWTILFLLLTALVMLSLNDSTIVTYRTMAFALILAPVGAHLRWALSDMNNLWEAYPWYPAGTLLGNLSGCLISIAAVAIEYRLDTRYYPHNDFFWAIGSLRAIRIGFAGCLTTVSTFVAEIHEFMRLKTDFAYPYMLSSIGVACVSSCILYALVVNIMPLFY